MKKTKEMFGKSVLIYKSYSIDQVGLARALGYYGNSLIHLENYTEARNNLEESLLIYQQSTPENPLNFLIGLRVIRRVSSEVRRF